MKFFAALLLALAPLGQTAFSYNNCGQGKLPSSLNGVCIQIKHYIEGCEQYQTQSKCSRCSSSYYLSSDAMCEYSGLRDEPNTLVGCLEWQSLNSGGKACTNCANGFVRRNGNCQKGVRDCQKYNQTTTECEECRTEYSLIMGECKHDYLLGCRNQNLDHTCKECLKPFIMNGNHCSISNCKNFNDFGCIGCECGYFLTEDRTCKEIKEGCLRYNRGICINCLPHYKLKGGICQIEGCTTYSGNSCSKCNVALYEMDSKTGGCSFKNCFEWHDNRCLICKQGYKRNAEGICEESSESACQINTANN